MVVLGHNLGNSHASVYRTIGPTLVYYCQIRTLVAMATYSLHRLIMGKVEIGNFYCLIGDNRILFLQKCLLNSSPYFIRLMSELPYLIGCWGNINSYISKKVCFSRTLSRFKVHQVHFYGISD